MRLSVWMVLLAATGCGGDDDDSGGVGTPAICAGNYAGLYSGDTSGSITGTLATDGTIAATFVESGSSTGYSGTSALGSDGTFTLVIFGNNITGRLDASCHASGTWNYPGVGQGTWEMQRQ